MEAGVDIDMDIGFKDRSIIDSDEQLAGRINRNVKKQDCKLFLFNYNNEKYIYGKDKRYELSLEGIDFEGYQKILCEKDFDYLYDLVIDDRNKHNKKEFIENFSDYEAHIKSLRYHSVHKDFRLIEQENISCFVPANIPIKIEVTGKTEEIFSKQELVFLNQNGVLPNAGNTINGEKVFDLYLSLLSSKKSFIQQKVEMKTMQSILSKFVFSIFANEKVEQNLVHYIDVEKSNYGYKYLLHWRQFYSIESGINEKKFKGDEILFL